MTQSNIGRVVFTSERSPANPLILGLGTIPAGGVKDVTVINMGLTPFFCYGRVNTTNTSPVMQLFPGHRGNMVLNGTAGQTAQIRLHKFLDPRYISLNSSAPVEDIPASAEVEYFGS